MGRDATKAVGNPWYEARKQASIYDDRLKSREGAAELLGMSSSSVAEAELGMTKCRLLWRLQIIDMARGMMNSIAIDSEGEDYDFKSFQFSGVNDVIGVSCNMLSAVSNIPQLILFGQKVGGLGNGDDTSMENWYNYVERIDKRMLKGNIRYLLSIVFQAGLATGEVDEVPKLKVSFNPLWSMSDAEKADLELKKEQTWRLTMPTRRWEETAPLRPRPPQSCRRT